MIQSNQYNIGHICTRQQCQQGRAQQVAMRWVASGTLERTDYTFQPKMPEQFFVFLGILKIKAIAGTLFSNFGDEALIDRLGEARGILTRRSLLKRVLRALPIFGESIPRVFISFPVRRASARHEYPESKP